MKNKILVVVDMQHDFITGSLGTPEAQAIVPKVVEKIQNWDGRQIVWTKDEHPHYYLRTLEGKKLPVEHCIEGTDGAEIEHRVSVAMNAKYPSVDEDGMGIMGFTKNTFGSVDLASHIFKEWIRRDLEEVVLMGLCTDICVISNALVIKAYAPWVEVTVDASCCAGVTPESHKNALAAMKMCQINIVGEDENG